MAENDRQDSGPLSRGGIARHPLFAVGAVLLGSFLANVDSLSPASGLEFALLPPDNATGNYTKVVQRIPVKIAFDDPSVAATLRPGLSVIATVRTRQ